MNDRPSDSSNDSTALEPVRVPRSGGVPVAIACFLLVAVLIVAAGMWGAGRPAATSMKPLAQGSGAPSAAPSAGASPSPSPRPTASPHPSPSPSPSPSPVVLPSPLPVGAPWDGLVWGTPVAANLPWHQVPGQLISWKGGYVGLGTVDGAGEVVVASSSDLAHWTVLARGAQAPLQTGLTGDAMENSAGFVKLLAVSGGLVAIGAYGSCAASCPLAEVWTSADGVTWKLNDSVPFGNSLSRVAGGPSGIVALGSRGTGKSMMWYSRTGESWRAVDLSASAFNHAGIADVGATPHGFVAVGGTNVVGNVSGTPAAWWSADGLTWSRAQVNGSTIALPFSYIDEVMSYGVIAMRGNEGVPWISADGRSWKPLPDSDMRSLMTYASTWADADRTVALVPSTGGGANEYWATTDGMSWRQLKVNGTGSWALDKAFITTDGLIAVAEVQIEGKLTLVAVRAVATT